MMPIRSPIGRSNISDLAVGLVTMMSPIWGDLWGGSLLHPAQFVGVGRAIVRWAGSIQNRISLSSDVISMELMLVFIFVTIRGNEGARVTLSPIL